MHGEVCALFSAHVRRTHTCSGNGAETAHPLTNDQKLALDRGKQPVSTKASSKEACSRAHRGSSPELSSCSISRSIEATAPIA
jgi:hypothetical protein